MRICIDFCEGSTSRSGLKSWLELLVLSYIIFSSTITKNILGLVEFYDLSGMNLRIEYIPDKRTSKNALNYSNKTLQYVRSQLNYLVGS